MDTSKQRTLSTARDTSFFSEKQRAGARGRDNTDIYTCTRSIFVLLTSGIQEFRIGSLP